MLNPVFCSNGTNTPAFAAKILASGKSDELLTQEEKQLVTEVCKQALRTQITGSILPTSQINSDAARLLAR
ncbi:hypothetical protein AMR41_21200 [Hapalosiphon sp. MRB220]|nr:hypothetical protein AMR41_21200 [Hapalosiphon sp. MRB220]